MNATSERLNLLLARLLLGCIWGSLVVLTVGVTLVVIENPRQIHPLPLLSPAELLSRVRVARGEVLVNLGLLVILLTPIVRVVTLAIYFLTRREGKYGLVSLLTLFLLLSDLFAALR
jgi:uncharacterized membrane protein